MNDSSPPGWLARWVGPPIRFQGEPEEQCSGSWVEYGVLGYKPGGPDSLTNGSWAFPPVRQVLSVPSWSNEAVAGIWQACRCLCELESQESHCESISANKRELLIVRGVRKVPSSL